MPADIQYVWNWESRAGLTSKISEGGSKAGSLLLRLRALIWYLKSRHRFPRFFSPSTWPLPPSTSPSSSSSAGKPSTSPCFPSSFASSLDSRVPSSSSQEIKCPLCAHLLAKPLPAAGAPPPPGERRAAAWRAPAFPYLTWTNACRQSQEFRPLTSASSSQGTARETEGEGVGTVGRKEGERHQPAAAPALPKFHFLSVGSLPAPARAFPG